MPTYELAIASDVLEGPDGASYIGITPITGLEAVPGITADQVQDALVAIKILLDAKLVGIQDNDVDVAFRSRINFTGDGFTITDDATNGVTEFHIPSLSDYPHVESVLDEGVDSGVHRKIDFQGTGVTVVEDTVNDKYIVTVPGTYIQRVLNEADDLGDQPELRFTGTGVTVTENTVDGRYEVLIDAFVPPPIVERVSNEADTLGEQPELRIISEWATLTENTVDGRYELEIPTPEPIPDIPEPAPPATNIVAGISQLSLPAVDPGVPIAAGDNDLRLSDERTPEDGSVTLPKAQDDVIFFYRCTSLDRPATAKQGQMLFETDTHSCQKNISSDPLAPNWVAVGSLADIPIADDGEANSEELVRASDSRLSNRRVPEDESVDLPTAAPEISLTYICLSTTRPTLPKRGQLIYETDTGIVMKNLGVPATPNWQPVGTGAANITFQEEGTTIAQRATLDVQGEGATVVDDADNLKTILEILGMNVQDEGVDVTPRRQVNFIGMSVVDDPVNNRVNVTPPGGAAKASDTVHGITKLSTAAVDPVDPIAAGTNDTRIPTQGENDALAGTSGTPSTSNKYVTEATVATETVAGIREIATQAEADAGTSDTVFLTPSKAANRPITKTVFEDYLTGLDLVWNSPGTNGTNITVKSGAAYIPSLGRIVDVPSTLAGPSMTFTASSWHYVYLYETGGTPTLDIASAAAGPPAAPYKGTARTRTSDTSKRLVGAFLTDGAGTPAARAFDMRGNDIHYTAASAAAPYRAASGVTAVAATLLSLASICPPGITTDIYGVVVGGQAVGTYALFLGLNSGLTVSTNFNGTFQWVLGTTGFTVQVGWVPVIPTTPSIYYLTSQPAGGTFSLDARGYRIVR